MQDPGMEPTLEWMPGAAASDEPEEDEGWAENAEPGSAAAPISRSSLNKFYNIIGSFNEYKKQLVRSTGFGGLLEIPRITRLNIRFSMWLLNRVDCQEFCIRLSGDRVMKLNPSDVALVFGVPCGEKDVLGPDAYVSQDAIECLQTSIGFTDKQGNKLKSVEEVLHMELDEQSPDIMVDAFKTAFVVYAMGKVLTPSSKHDYLNVTFWGALVRPEEIKNFNWAGHVFNALIGSARKAQADQVRKGTVSNISGCHLFLQVLYLDNLELGPLKRPQDNIPRIKDFSSENLSKMIAADSCRSLSTGETIFGITQHFRPLNEVQYKCFGAPQQTLNLNDQSQGVNQTLITKSTAQTPPPNVVTDRQHTGDMDVPNYSSPLGHDQKKLLNLIRQEYPHLERSKIADELKKFNAIYINLTMNYRREVTDQIARISHYILHCVSTGEGKEQLGAAMSTPAMTRSATASAQSHGPRKSAASNIVGQQLELSDQFDDTASTPPARVAVSVDLPKRNIHYSGSQGMKKQRSCASAGDVPIMQQTTSMCSGARSRFAKPPPPASSGITQDDLQNLQKDCSIMVLNQMCAADEVEGSDGKILYGQRCTEPISKSRINLNDKARSPWNMGCIHPLNDASVTQQLATWVYAASDVYLRRKWIIHEVPKHIELNGESFKSSLVSSNPMSIEICDILIRRLMQLDSQMHANAWKCRWRHWLESDFFGFAVAGYNLLDIQSIREQFVGTDVPYSLAACRMILAPACINQAWCCFVFDMWNKVIYVLDPLGPNPNTRIKVHIARMLLKNLIQCIHSFFENWKPNDKDWDVQFPVLDMDSCSTVDSGVCMLHCARHFTGDNLATPLRRSQIASLRNSLLCEALTIQGNNTAIPLALKTIIGDSVF